MLSYDDFVALLVRLRVEGGDTQASLARKLDVVPSTVGNWEARYAKVPFDTGVKWLGIYGHTLQALPTPLAAGPLGENQDDARAILVRLLSILARLDSDALLDVEAIAVRLAPKDARKLA